MVSCSSCLAFDRFWKFHFRQHPKGRRCRDHSKCSLGSAWPYRDPCPAKRQLRPTLLCSIKTTFDFDIELGTAMFAPFKYTNIDSHIIIISTRLYFMHTVTCLDASKPPLSHQQFVAVCRILSPLSQFDAFCRARPALSRFDAFCRILSKPLHFGEPYNF